MLEGHEEEFVTELCNIVNNRNPVPTGFGLTEVRVLEIIQPSL
jgi:hypothetical protein